MSLYTNFLRLLKPEQSDKYNINVFNGNADLIDSEFSRLEQKNQSQDNLLATKESLNAHTNNTNNPHEVTKSQVGLGNVENKSSAAIRGEITKDNVTEALGYTLYTPNEIDDKYEDANSKKHTHENKSVLDKLSASENGCLLYEGKEISNSDMKKIIFSDTEPTAVAEDEIVMVYEE